MTRLSTGYTFLNIQDHSKYITNNIDIDILDVCAPVHIIYIMNTSGVHTNTLCNINQALILWGFHK